MFLLDFSSEPKIIQGIREVGDLLLNVKGNFNMATATAAQKSALTNEAEEVLRPLMDALDGSLSFYAQACEKTIFKRLLKELWRITIRTLEKTVVLPPMTDRTVTITRI